MENVYAGLCERNLTELYNLNRKRMEITGRLTRDAQVRNYSGKDVVQFSVAVNDSYKNKDGERITKTEFFNCSYWLTKGSERRDCRGGWMGKRRGVCG